MINIVTIKNITEIEYTALMDLLHDILTKDLPDVSIDHPVDSVNIEQFMVFFANQHSYITELWAKMSHEVRILKRASVNKDAIDEAMGKRDYLEKIMDALKIKHYAARTMLYHAGEDK